MSFRDHLLAAGLALLVMALSLTIGHGDELAERPTDVDPIEIAG